MSNQNPFRSMKTNPASIDQAALCRAAQKLLGTTVLSTDVTATPLHGGTLGDVQLLSGTAQTTDGRALPFRIVQKTQKRWERPGDPGSWRREYDLFRSPFHTLFMDAFSCPQLYEAQESENENRLYMAYVEGVSGAALTLDDLTLAADALGRFQVRCHEQAARLQAIPCLSDPGYMRRDFSQWTPDTVEYQYLRSSDCALPVHLRQMLIELQNDVDSIFQAMAHLPLVLCHRDYWTENIFVSGGRVIAIDWDCAGFGVPGEDIASLIADETPAGQIGAYYRRLLPAYYQSLRTGLALPPMEALPIREMILFRFGYRFLQQLMFSPARPMKDEAIQALEEIHALPKMP